MNLASFATQVPWGNNVILVGGKTEPPADHLSGMLFLHHSSKGNFTVGHYW
jgi:hypothetical protein